MSSPAPPRTLRLDDALDSSEPLARLLARVGESRRRFEVLRDGLPPALAAEIRPGPLDEQGWTLLASQPSAAAKLRQMLPLLERRLAEAGFPAIALRIRIQPPP